MGSTPTAAVRQGEDTANPPEASGKKTTSDTGRAKSPATSRKKAAKKKAARKKTTKKKTAKKKTAKKKK